MNYDFFLDNLEQWTEEELFYRDYYFASKSPNTLQAFLENTAADQYYKDYVLHPETLRTALFEDRYFKDNHNVSLLKHPRYLPFFTHTHSFFEALYVVSGQCTSVINLRRTTLATGDLCFIAPEVKHGIEVFDDSIVLNILIRRSTFMDIFFNSVRNKNQISLFFLGNLYGQNNFPYLLFHTCYDTIVQNYIFDMYMEQFHNDEYSDRIICSLLVIFFNQLTRRHGKQVVLPAPNTKAKYTDEMLSYIFTHYSSITLNELAEYFHFSAPYCSKMIKLACGCSFSDLVTNIRMQQGQNLLLNTQMRIADISDRLGYKNPETFIRCFTRIYHITPSQYRNQASLDPAGADLLT